MSRVVLSPSAYLPTLGGVQELTRALALALVDSGDEVEIWWQQDTGVGESTVETLDGLTVRRFPFPLPSSRPTSLATSGAGAVSTLRSMRRAVKQFRPDVINVQCFGPNGAYVTALSRLTGVPLVVTLQGETMMDDHDIYETSTTMRTALRLGLKQAKAVTGCSAFTLHDAERRFGLRPGRGRVIFNGVVVDAPPVESAASVDRDRFVLALGRVVEKKGFDLLMQAFARIANDHPDVSLAIAGDGEQLAALRDLAATLGLGERVRFLGRLSRTEVADTMAVAEVFVMPSRLEPFGIVTLEAWRAGCAVVATSIGGAPEFVDDGRTGLLANPFDADELARALDRLLGDANFRVSIGDAGRERAKEFSWSTIADRYRAVYAEATG